MASVAARIGPFDRVRARSLAVPATAVGLLVLMGLSLLLRTRALRAGFWIDEGISVGIASYPLTEIPSVLRLDGSPPLYYMILHVWMGIAGQGEAATHGLSVGFALLVIPTAWLAGRSLDGVRAAWIGAVIAALHPFLTYYAQETRMYAMVVLLSLAFAAAFAHAYALRDRRWLPAVVVLGALLLYAHNWTLFLLAGSVPALALLWRDSDGTGRRALVRDVLLGYGGIALLYLPWLGNLVFQAGHTGAPWARRPGFDELSNGFASILGGWKGAAVFALIAGVGLAALMNRRVPVPGAPRPVGSERGRRVAEATTALLLGGILTAWLVSQVSPAWATRYLAVFVGPAILAGALGLAHARRVGVAALVVLAVIWADARERDLQTKSNVREVTGRIAYRPVGAGDLVVSTHPEQMPVLRYYLGDEFRYATSLGAVRDARVFNWVDALPRLRETRPTPTARRLVDTLQPGQALVLVLPNLRPERWGAPWTRLVRRRGVQWERALDRDPRLRRVEALPRYGLRSPPRGVHAVIYRVRDTRRGDG